MQPLVSIFAPFGSLPGKEGLQGERDALRLPIRGDYDPMDSKRQAILRRIRIWADNGALAAAEFFFTPRRASGMN
jgi:hypothetical protein